MLDKITPISESVRLSRSPMHQGIVVVLQSEFDGLRLKRPGVILEISSEALKAANLAKQDENNSRVTEIKKTSRYSGHKPTR